MKWIDYVVAGSIKPDTIDDYVAAWHNIGAESITIWEFLGLTCEEYKQWAVKPDTLDDIIQRRRERKGDV